MSTRTILQSGAPRRPWVVVLLESQGRQQEILFLHFYFLAPYLLFLPISPISAVSVRARAPQPTAGQNRTHCLHSSPPLSEGSCWSAVKPAASLLWLHCLYCLQLFSLPSSSEFQTTHFPVHSWTDFLGMLVCYAET